MTKDEQHSHTSGPWKLSTRYPKSAGVICIEHPRFDALDVTTREWARTLEEHQANAYLVMAGPDMKGALEFIAANSGDPVMERVALAAIAKAEGR